jgi:hypothetical protein
VSERTVEQEARRILAWHAHGGNIRQVDSIVLRDMDANEENPRRVHLIPIGEAIGVAITTSRAAPEDKDIVYVSSHALGAAFAALGFSVSPTIGGAIIAPRFATPDYKPDDEVQRG